jgi:hypothetical protein
VTGGIRTIDGIAHTIGIGIHSPKPKWTEIDVWNVKSPKFQKISPRAISQGITARDGITVFARISE